MAIKNQTSNFKLQTSKSPRVAIVHDWLVGGGAEKVVQQLHEMFPGAPIYTSYCTKRWRRELDNKVVTGWLQYWPLSKLRKFVPFLRIWWFSRLNLDAYDLVISSSGAEAKGIKIRGQRNSWKHRLLSTNYQLPTTKATHVAYMHAPTHYYWSRYDDYLKNPGFGKLDWLARLGLKLLIGPLRKWDFKAAQRPNYILANSNHIAQQIKKYYKRSAEVVHPPIDTERFALPHEKHGLPNIRKGFVITGRQTPYKRVDLAVAACTELNVPLIVIGNGPDHKKLKKLAGRTITFLTKVTDKELPHYLQSAEAFIFPAKDDFGIAPVEALAAGTPVIAYKAGGALDYVVEGKTGTFFNDQTVDSLVACLQNFKPGGFSHSEIMQYATGFSARTFRDKMTEVISEVMS